jgi:hypothetical protein
MAEHVRPDFPTMEPFEKARCEQLARWYRFLLQDAGQQRFLTP